jgi:hypothetical protein
MESALPAPCPGGRVFLHSFPRVLAPRFRRGHSKRVDPQVLATEHHRVQQSRRLASCFATQRRPVVPSQGYGTQRPLAQVVVDRQSDSRTRSSRHSRGSGDSPEDNPPVKRVIRRSCRRNPPPPAWPAGARECSWVRGLAIVLDSPAGKRRSWMTCACASSGNAPGTNKGVHPKAQLRPPGRAASPGQARRPLLT